MGEAWPQRLRSTLRSWAESPSPTIRALSRAAYACGKAWRYLRDPRFRSEVHTRLRHGNLHFQGSTYTLKGRYVLLFEHCKESLRDVPRPKVLSFGCSTGEEVVTLAQYLPSAHVTGVDINRWCIQHCQRTHAGDRLRFLHRFSPKFESLEGLDAIFCLAVFQRTENGSAKVIQSGFTFDVFEAAIVMLDRKLKAGGLIFIDQCDFRFEETSVAANYEPVASPANQRVRDRKLFDRTNTVVADEYTPQRIFLKRTDTRLIE